MHDVASTAAATTETESGHSGSRVRRGHVFRVASPEFTTAAPITFFFAAAQSLSRWPQAPAIAKPEPLSADRVIHRDPAAGARDHNRARCIRAWVGNHSPT